MKTIYRGINQVSILFSANDEYSYTNSLLINLVTSISIPKVMQWLNAIQEQEVI